MPPTLLLGPYQVGLASKEAIAWLMPGASPRPRSNSTTGGASWDWGPAVYDCCAPHLAGEKRPI